MAGGGTSWQDLSLYLIARVRGVEGGDRGRARLHAAMARSWPATVRGADEPSSERRRRDQSLPGMGWRTLSKAGAVGGMLAISGLSERTFFRRFKKATGLTPIDYLHAVRIEEAKQLLETTDTPVEAVATRSVTRIRASSAGSFGARSAYRRCSTAAILATCTGS